MTYPDVYKCFLCTGHFSPGDGDVMIIQIANWNEPLRVFICDRCWQEHGHELNAFVDPWWSKESEVKP